MFHNADPDTDAVIALSSRRLAGALVAAALLLAPWLARASDQRASEFWPELNATVRIDDHSRLFLLGTLARARD